MKYSALKLTMALAIGSLSAFTSNVMAEESALTQQEFNQMLIKAFEDNPEFLIKGIENVRTYSQEMKMKRFSDALYHDADSPVLNNAGEITVVEFFDYNCGYCKRSSEELSPLIGKDKRIRFVYKDVAILGANSTELAKIAIAVGQISPNSYPAFHKELMSMDRATPEKAIGLAEMVGVSEEKIKSLMESGKVDSILAKNNQLFRDLGLTGTPTFYIGTKKVGGAISRSALQSEVATQHQALMAKKN
ncbi:DsbA family protein [Vibrio sp. SCSIO 43140]|uniref:DsbA family protein n=1 Tax=Vibrio sp. SCSIO 43140 TaxID=2819100 RepID=UPI0020756D51|nr:DsbA family protein [Vibrio sp. SCSIO 43140]USD59083.1 DsbA family protein [Vibrio sp. SCSIO 43140]